MTRLILLSAVLVAASVANAGSYEPATSEAPKILPTANVATTTNQAIDASTITPIRGYTYWGGYGRRYPGYYGYRAYRPYVYDYYNGYYPGYYSYYPGYDYYSAPYYYPGYSYYTGPYYGGYYSAPYYGGYYSAPYYGAYRNYGPRVGFRYRY
jgi:hypothetical protein